MKIVAAPVPNGAARAMIAMTIAPMVALTAPMSGALPNGVPMNKDQLARDNPVSR